MNESNSSLKSFHIDYFPDSILLEIFSKLEYNELCTCSRVCHRWQRLAKDFTLKKSIIVKKSLQEKQLLSLIKNHFTDDVEEFQLMKSKFDSSSYCSSTKRDRLVPIKKGSLWQMSDKSRKLKKLVLMSCSLPKVSMSDLPFGLLHLSIRESKLDLKLLFGTNFSISHLTCLDLGGCSDDVTSEVLHVLTEFKSLRALYLEGCCRINNAGIESIQEILPQLEILDIEGTDVSNEGVCMILDICDNIRNLFVGHTSITDPAISKSKHNSVPNLSEFCVRSTSLSSVALHAFLLTHVTNKMLIRTDIHCSNKCFNDSDCLHALSDNLPSYSVGEQCNHYLFHRCSRKQIL